METFDFSSYELPKSWLERLSLHSPESNHIIVFSPHPIMHSAEEAPQINRAYSQTAPSMFPRSSSAVASVLERSVTSNIPDM